MTRDLEIHPASAAERADAFRNLHDIWSRGLDAEDHLRWRLSYPKHKNAVWYVGCLDGRVVTGCGCYSLELQVDGRIERACAFGEVHTLPEFRGGGFAPRLLAYAEEHQRSLGGSVSLLYSDIDPSYYSRLGYLKCACFEGWADPRQHADLWSGSTDDLAAFNGAGETSAMAALYDAHHAPLPLWIARSQPYWNYLIARDPQDEFHWFTDASGDRLGYVRMTCTDAEAKLRDWGLVDRSAELCRRFFHAVLKHAANRRISRVGGWMPASPVYRDLFAISERTREITMLKPLAPKIAITSQHCDAAQHFHEMDHV